MEVVQGRVGPGRRAGQGKQVDQPTGMIPSSHEEKLPGASQRVERRVKEIYTCGWLPLILKMLR